MKTSIASIALVGALGASGCQFFFPTPIEEHEAPKAGAPAMVHAVGVPFRAGEVMKGEVFLDAIRAGTGELRVTQACDEHGKPAVLIVLSAASTGLARMIKSADTKSEVYLDADSGVPLSAHTSSNIGDEATDVVTVYAPSKFMFRQKRTTSEGQGESVNVDTELRSVPIESVPHNADSFLGYLRNWKPAAGTSGYILAALGKHVWRADMTFVGSETIHTTRGDEKAFRIDGVGQKLVGRNPKDLAPSDVTPKRAFSMWISDDDRHAPLRVVIDAEIAKVTVELTGYEVQKTTSDPSAACKPLFDGEALEREAVVAEQTRKASPHDDENDEKDGIQKILKSP